MWTYATLPFSIQLKTAVIALLVASLFSLWPNLMRGPRRAFRCLAQRPYLSALCIGCLSLTLNILLACIRFPLPWIHDEYSYLLASDTFSQFRLANPPHPLWQHFESFHILSQPSYASKYPPGQGLALACGQLLCGYPIVGVWLSLAAACVGMYWMLRAWTRPQWALWGGLAIAIHAPILRAWGQSYWGGALAMLGAALVFGGIRRLWKTPRLLDAVCLGVGLMILANTRPAEGFLVSLPVLAVLVRLMLRSDIPLPIKLSRVLVPLSVMGICCMAAMATYNQATTGSSTKLAYQLHDKTYSASSLVIWKPQPAIPSYNHPRMRDFYLEFGRERALQLRQPTTYLRTLADKLYLLWDFFPLGLGVGLLCVPWLWRDAWLRLGLCTLGLLLVLQLQLASSWMFPHYLAPAVGLFYAVNIAGLRRLYAWQRQHHLGQILTRAVMIGLILKLGVTLLAWTSPIQEHRRQEIAASLSRDTTAKHLVIVSYSPLRSPHKEYVYNEANIDAANIVWARDMGPTQNERLIQYFADRKIWRWHLGDDDTETWQQLVPSPPSSVDCKTISRLTATTVDGCITDSGE